jgi:hypothetical protein
VLSVARLRFGVVSESVREGRTWLDFARQVEDSGIDVLLLRDHFSAGAFGQQLAPFSGLAAAAAVTTRLRVGTLVLSNDFRHPAIVAHEAASLHLVSGGRFELGLGAGWYQPEYDGAGIAFDAPSKRIARLGESLSIIKELLAGTPVRHMSGFYRIDGLDLDVLPTPRPSSPRLLVGAGGRIRSARISKRARSDSACHISLPAKTTCPRLPRSSAACKPGRAAPPSRRHTHLTLTEFIIVAAMRYLGSSCLVGRAAMKVQHPQTPAAAGRVSLWPA